MQSLQSILAKALEGQRLSSQDALILLCSEDWPQIVATAKIIRDRLHAPQEVSYTAFRVINYTNYCNVDCSFCSFKDEIESDKGYTLSLAQIAAKTEEALALGVDQIFLQGGVNPKLPLTYYTDALEMLSQKYQVHVRGFSPVELARLAEKEKMPLHELLLILKSAGLASVPGAGAEILTDSMRQILSPKKLSGKEWCAVMGECHQVGLLGSCNIVFGSVETNEDIIEHLQLLREQQDKTGGFLSFIPWVFQQQTKRFTVKHVKGWEYLRLIAISRLFLDNIPNIEVSVLGMGKDLGELALFSGANDINSIVIEENVLRSSGLKTLRAARRFIEEAGFIPVRRTLNYETKNYIEVSSELSSQLSEGSEAF